MTIFSFANCVLVPNPLSCFCVSYILLYGAGTQSVANAIKLEAEVTQVEELSSQARAGALT